MSAIVVEALKVIGKAAAHALKDAAEETPAEKLDKERKEREENQRKLEAGKAKLANNLPATTGVAADAIEISRVLATIDENYKNLNEVIEKVQRIVNRPENRQLKEDTSKQLEQLSKKADRKQGGEYPETTTSEETRKVTEDNTRALESLKSTVASWMGKAFFTRKAIDAQVADLEEVHGSGANLLVESKMPQQSAQKLNETRMAIASMNQAERMMRAVENHQSQSETKQREVVTETKEKELATA